MQTASYCDSRAGPGRDRGQTGFLVVHVGERASRRLEPGQAHAAWREVQVAGGSPQQASRVEAFHMPTARARR